MVDTELSIAVLPPQDPRLQLLSPNQGRLQGQIQDDPSLYQNQDYHRQDQEQRQQLEDITRQFLMQDMAADPTGVVQGSQALHHHHHHGVSSLSGEAEEELNIYDYIHAKQEDEEDVEDHGHTLDHDSSPLSSTHVAKDNVSSPATDPYETLSNVPSPAHSAYSPSPPSFSAMSPSSPPASAFPSSVDQHDSAAADALVGKDCQAQDSIHIKQEVLDNPSLLHHSSYMDTSMELYTAGDPSPPQDLFRMLMEELQTQAAIQREKFFTATTGSGTGMDSVEFLFNGPQTQAQAATQAKAVPHFMTESATNLGMLSTGSNACLDLETEQQGPSDLGPTSMPTPMHLDDLAASAPGLETTSTSTSAATALQDVTMETAEPEGELPTSPTYSPSTSGSVTPELTSPLLHPTTATSSAGCSPVSPVSPLLPKAATGRLSIQPAIVRHNRRRSAADALKDEPPSPSTITILPAPTKKRKLSHNVDNRGSSTSPRLSALPSPPSSVRTTPPLQPTAVDVSSIVEKLNLPPARLDQNATAHDSQPVTPTSPSPQENAAKGDGPEATSPDATMDTPAGDSFKAPTESSASDSTAGKKARSSNANNKRPWTAEEEKLLLKLVDELMPIKDIAETLNRSVHSVRSRRQVLTDPGFVKGNGHAQPRRSKPDPSSKLPTYSQMAFLSLARLPELQGTLNDVASMVEKLFSRHLNRIPRTGHKNLQIWRAQISDALAHEKGHPRPRFESFGVKRGRQWVYRLTSFGKGVMEAMGGVDQICEELLKNNEMAGSSYGPDGESIGMGGAGAGLGQGNG
ncbi:hypothetical protein BGZ54_002412, partial [Gamsiella multidivaricata]